MLALALALAAGPVDVRWTAPESCPSSRAVQEAVASNLARDDFGEALEGVRVEARAEPDSAGWRLRVEVQLPEGAVTRELTASTCEELAAAAGLIIAVALDPLRVQEVRPPPPPEPRPELAPSPVVAEPRVVAEPAREAEPPSRPRFRFDLRAAGMLDAGTLPALRGGAALDFGLVGTWFRADARVLYWAPRTVLPFEAAGVGARLQQGGAGARVCLKPELGAWEPSTCGGVEGGVAVGRGVGLEQPRTTALPWVTATAGLEVAWVSAASVGLFAGIDAQFHAVRPHVRLDGLGDAIRVAPVGARGLAGVLFRMPR